MLLYSYEKRGMVVIILLITCLGVLPRQFLHKKQDLLLIPVSDVFLPDSLHHVSSVADSVYQQPPKVRKLELNSADSASLVKIKGIGPYYAMKILKYRKRLGGFISVKQLKEVNMTYFNADSLSYLFRADTSLIVKKDLDTMEFRDILRHPYFEYEDVKLIFNAKRKYQHVSFDVLKEKKIFPDDKLKKIKPYFR